MIIYLFIIFIILFFFKRINNKHLNFYDFILLTILVCVCGLRYNVGSDYSAYVGIYNDLSLYPRTELLIVYLIKFIQFIHGNSYIFIFLLSFFTITIFYKAIKKQTIHFSQSIFYFIVFGYYAMCFNGARQMLAASICLYATTYINDKKMLKYIITIFIASLCHQTALVMLPVYFICNKNFSNKFYYIMYFLLLSVGLIYQPFLAFVTSMFPQYSAYFVKTTLTFWEPGLGTYVIGTFHLILIFICIIKRKELVNKNKYMNNYITLFLFSVPFFSLSFTNALIVRIAYYFSIYLILILPDLLETLFTKKNDKVYALLCVFFIGYFLIHLYSFNAMIPYSSIFSI